MAISSRVFSTAFLSPETTSAFLGPSSSGSGFLPPANVRMVHKVTLATASKPVTGKREPRGIMKPRRVSPEMEALVGAPEIPRTKALKLIWAYIKEHNLQDPENKKIIVCDEKLKKIFGGGTELDSLRLQG